MKSHAATAWKLTTEASLIKKFYFFPSFIDTLILSISIFFQVAFFWVYVVGFENDIFVQVVDFGRDIFLEDNWIFGWGGLTVLGIAYFFSVFIIKNVYEGGLIHLTDAYFKQNKHTYKYFAAIRRGYESSIGISAYNTLFFWAKATYIVYIFSWGLRFLGVDYVGVTVTIVIVFTIAMSVARILFSYTRYFIVLDDMNLFKALGQSLLMAFGHLDTTVKLLVALLVVYIRITIITVAMILLPLLVSVILALNLGQILFILAIIFLIIIYLLLIAFISYINAILEIFVETIWYSVYRQNRFEDES